MAYPQKPNPFPKPKPRRTLKIRGFLGIDQSGDPNDLDPKYSANAHNAIYTNGSIRRAYGMEQASQAPAYGTIVPSNIRVFTRVDADGTQHKWFIVRATDGTSTQSVWVRCVDGVSDPTYPKTWQKILTLAEPATSMYYTVHKYNFVNYQDGAVGEVIFTTGGGDIYKWAGTYTGGVADQATKLYYVDETTHAPRGTLIALYKERVFIAGVKESPDTVYWSNELSPGDWTEDEANPNDAGHIDIPTWDGDHITAIVPLNDELLIFKQKRLFRLAGSSPADYTLTEVARVGTFQQTSVTVSGESAYFMAQEGLMLFNGISLSVYLSAAQMGRIYSGYDPQSNGWPVSIHAFHTRLIIAVQGWNSIYPYAGENQKTNPHIIEVDLPTKTMSYHVDMAISRNPTTGEETQETHYLDCAELNNMLFFSALGTIAVYSGGFLDHTLVKNTSTSALTSGNIRMFHAIPATDFGIAGKKKRVSKIAVSGNGNYEAAQVKITPICDGIAKRPINLTLPAENGTCKPKNVSWFGRKIGLWVENVDGAFVEITDIEMEYTVQGV